MKIQVNLFFIILSFLALSCILPPNSSRLTDSIDSTPCNDNAMDDAKSILKYIAELSSVNVHDALVGQNCFLRWRSPQVIQNNC